MQLTLSVRNTKTGAVSTHVESFQGEKAAGRALYVLTSMIESWVIKDKGELIVATLTERTPNVTGGD